MFRAGNRWPFQDVECHGLVSPVYAVYILFSQNLWFIRTRQMLLLSGLLWIGCFPAPSLCFLNRHQEALSENREVLPAGAHHNVFFSCSHSDSSVPYKIFELARESLRGDIGVYCTSLGYARMVFLAGAGNNGWGCCLCKHGRSHESCHFRTSLSPPSW